MLTVLRLVETCYNKCIPNKYLEPELNKGESVCVDRCVGKFFDANTKIGEVCVEKEI